MNLVIDKKKISLLLGLIASAFSLWITFQGVNWNELLIVLTTIKLSILVYLSILNLIFIFLRALRWKILLSRIKPINLLTITEISQLGAFINNILPLRIGELIRALVLKKRYGLSGAEVIGNIILERMLDLIAIVFLIFLVLLFGEVPEKFDRVIGYAIRFVAIFVGLILLVSFLLKRRLQRRTEAAKGWKGLIYRLSDGVNGLYDWKTSIPSFLLSLGMWFTSACTILLFSSLHSGTISLFASLVVTVLIAIGVTIPAAPGFVGTYHLFCKIGLVAYGVSPEYAVAIAIITHFASYFWTNVTGILSMIALKLNWHDINIFRKETNFESIPMDDVKP